MKPIITLKKEYRKQFGTKHKYMYEKKLFDSKEEVYFYWWLQELKNRGYVEDIFTHPIENMFVLSDRICNNYRQKGKPKEQFIFHPKTYTPDFVVIWSSKGRNLFYNEWKAEKKESLFSAHWEIVHFVYGYQSYHDVKPNYTVQDSQKAVFALKQNWVHDKFGKIINKTILFPNKKNKKWTPKKTVFTETFVPERFLWTDAGKKERKINYPHKTFEDFICQSKK